MDNLLVKTTCIMDLMIYSYLLHWLHLSRRITGRLADMGMGAKHTVHTRTCHEVNDDLELKIWSGNVFNSNFSACAVGS